MLEAVWLVERNPETVLAPRSLSFSVPSELKAVREVRRRVGDFARDLCFDAGEVEGIQTAVGEAALNGVKHGSPRGREDQIRIYCRTEPDGLTVEVSDSGPGFDPSAVPAPVPDQLKPSGYGLFLMRGLMDDVTVHSNGHGTTVRLYKRCRAGGDDRS